VKSSSHNRGVFFGSSGAGGKESLHVGRALQREVVKDDDLSVLRALDVDLDEFSALPCAQLEGRHRVLGRVGRGTTMCDDPGPGRESRAAGLRLGPRRGGARREQQREGCCGTGERPCGHRHSVNPGEHLI
jgi:hypothetical protein